MQTQLESIKTLLIGDGGVGKTVLAKFILGTPLPDSYSATIGLDFFSYTSGQYRIQLWDTAGQERFRELLSSYMRRSPPVNLPIVFLICVNISEAYDEEKIQSFLEMVPSEDVQNIVVVGIKRAQAEVDSQAQVEHLCRRLGHRFMAINPYDAADAPKRQELLETITQLFVQSAGNSAEVSGTRLTVSEHVFLKKLSKNPSYTNHTVLEQQSAVQHVEQGLELYCQKSLQQYSSVKQYAIKHHCINVCSKLALLSLAVASGFAFAQISPLVGLVVAASSLLIAVVMEQGMAEKTGHLFGFFSPLDSAAATLFHEQRARLR